MILITSTVKTVFKRVLLMLTTFEILILGMVLVIYGWTSTSLSSDVYSSRLQSTLRYRDLFNHYLLNKHHLLIEDLLLIMYTYDITSSAQQNQQNSLFFNQFTTTKINNDCSFPAISLNSNSNYTKSWFNSVNSVDGRMKGSWYQGEVATSTDKVSLADKNKLVNFCVMNSFLSEIVMKHLNYANFSPISLNYYTFTFSNSFFYQFPLYYNDYLITGNKNNLIDSFDAVQVTNCEKSVNHKYDPKCRPSYVFSLNNPNSNIFISQPTKTNNYYVSDVCVRSNDVLGCANYNFDDLQILQSKLGNTIGNGKDLYIVYLNADNQVSVIFNTNEISNNYVSYGNVLGLNENPANDFFEAYLGGIFKDFITASNVNYTNGNISSGNCSETVKADLRNYYSQIYSDYNSNILPQIVAKMKQYQKKSNNLRNLNNADHEENSENRNNIYKNENSENRNNLYKNENSENINNLYKNENSENRNNLYKNQSSENKNNLYKNENSESKRNLENVKNINNNINISSSRQNINLTNYKYTNHNSTRNLNIVDGLNTDTNYNKISSPSLDNLLPSDYLINLTSAYHFQNNTLNSTITNSSLQEIFIFPLEISFSSNSSILTQSNMTRFFLISIDTHQKYENIDSFFSAIVIEVILYFFFLLGANVFIWVGFGMIYYYFFLGFFKPLKEISDDLNYILLNKVKNQKSKQKQIKFISLFEDSVGKWINNIFKLNDYKEIHDCLITLKVIKIIKEASSIDTSQELNYSIGRGDTYLKTVVDALFFLMHNISSDYLTDFKVDCQLMAKIIENNFIFKLTNCKDDEEIEVFYEDINRIIENVLESSKERHHSMISRSTIFNDAYLTEVGKQKRSSRKSNSVGFRRSVSNVNGGNEIKAKIQHNAEIKKVFEELKKLLQYKYCIFKMRTMDNKFHDGNRNNSDNKDFDSEENEIDLKLEKELRRNEFYQDDEFDELNEENYRKNENNVNNYFSLNNNYQENNKVSSESNDKNYFKNRNTHFYNENIINTGNKSNSLNKHNPEIKNTNSYSENGNNSENKNDSYNKYTHKNKNLHTPSNNSNNKNFRNKSSVNNHNLNRNSIIQKSELYSYFPKKEKKLSRDKNKEEQEKEDQIISLVSQFNLFFEFSISESRQDLDMLKLIVAHITQSGLLFLIDKEDEGIRHCISAMDLIKNLHDSIETKGRLSKFAFLIVSNLFFERILYFIALLSEKHEQTKSQFYIYLNLLDLGPIYDRRVRTAILQKLLDHLEKSDTNYNHQTKKFTPNFMKINRNENKTDTSKSFKKLNNLEINLLDENYQIKTEISENSKILNHSETRTEKEISRNSKILNHSETKTEKEISQIFKKLNHSETKTEISQIFKKLNHSETNLINEDDEIKTLKLIRHKTRALLNMSSLNRKNILLLIDLNLPIAKETSFSQIMKKSLNLRDNFIFSCFDTKLYIYSHKTKPKGSNFFPSPDDSEEFSHQQEIINILEERCDTDTEEINPSDPSEFFTFISDYKKVTSFFDRDAQVRLDTSIINYAKLNQFKNEYPKNNNFLIAFTTIDSQFDFGKENVKRLSHALFDAQYSLFICILYDNKIFHQEEYKKKFEQYETLVKNHLVNARVFLLKSFTLLKCVINCVSPTKFKEFDFDAMETFLSCIDLKYDVDGELSGDRNNNSYASN